LSKRLRLRYEELGEGGDTISLKNVMNNVDYTKCCGFHDKEFNERTKICSWVHCYTF